MDAGVLALATLWQAYGNVGDRDAVELTVMDKRWQMVLDSLDAAQPLFRQRMLFNFRMRLIAHPLDKTLLDRTVALAEPPGASGPDHYAPPLFGAGWVEETLYRLGHALQKAVGRAAEALTTSTEMIVAEAGLGLAGHSRLKAALDLDWGAPTARERAVGAPLRLVLEEVERWKSWLEQPHLVAQQSPMQEMMETIAQIVEQDTALDPEGGPGGRRIKQPVAHDRRLAIEGQDMRHGCKSSAKTFHDFKEHFLLALDSKVTREVVCPAHEPEYDVVELLAAEWEKSPCWLEVDIDLGSMASPRMVQWAAQGVSIIARPWPQGGPLFTKHDCNFAFA